MATETKIARVAFMDRGVYSGVTEYNKWDFVTTEDSTYLYIGEPPAIGKPVTDTAYWKCIADGKQATLAAAAAQVAKENAETAASLANGKAELANQATIRANTATENANTATTEANTATTEANTATTEANTATENANTATNKANTSALNADEKAGLAVTATQNANDKITEIDEVVIPNAELATQNAIDVKTNYETVVKPDMIAKANYAEAQGDYAKAQGDYAKQEALAVADIVIETKGNALTIEEVTAQAIVALQNRIIALEKLITDGLLGNIEIMNLDIIENFNIWGKSNLILTGNTPPNVIPDFVGQTFIDTTNKVAYTATGINSVSDWK